MVIKWPAIVSIIIYEYVMAGSGHDLITIIINIIIIWCVGQRGSMCLPKIAGAI